jgi:hypothetical protein
MQPQGTPVYRRCTCSAPRVLGGAPPRL